MQHAHSELELGAFVDEHRFKLSHDAGEIVLRAHHGADVFVCRRRFLAKTLCDALDQLLGGRDAMTRFLEEQTTAKAARFGIRIDRLGVKDVVLPGEMKTLLNRVIEVEKQAVANVILPREHTLVVQAAALCSR